MFIIKEQKASFEQIKETTILNHSSQYEIDFLYRHIHSQHHRLVVPYAIGALYNHPLEGLLLDTLGEALSFLVSGITAQTAVIFFCFAVIKTVDDHSGLWLPGNIFHLFFQNNTAYHDVHHQLQGLKYNYSQPFFSIWDRLLGTHMPYHLVKLPEGGVENRKEKELKGVKECWNGSVESEEGRRSAGTDLLKAKKENNLKVTWGTNICYSRGGEENVKCHKPSLNERLPRETAAQAFSHNVASPPSSTTRSGSHSFPQSRARSVDHQYSLKVMPFYGKTEAETHAMAEAAWSCVEKMLPEHLSA
ncbi:hypothetical protein WN943_020369 [Citrus x changshan-huyou]